MPVFYAQTSLHSIATWPSKAHLLTKLLNPMPYIVTEFSWDVSRYARNTFCVTLQLDS